MADSIEEFNNKAKKAATVAIKIDIFRIHNDIRSHKKYFVKEKSICGFPNPHIKMLLLRGVK